MDMSEFVSATHNTNVPKRHSQTRNVARLRKQMQEEEEIFLSEVIKSADKPDLNSSRHSQAKQKLTSMKHSFVKRCKSIKKKVGKMKKVDSKNNNDIETAERIGEERDAWVRSPVRTRLQARREKILENSTDPQPSQNEQFNNITERKRKGRTSLHRNRPRARGFLQEYELTIGHLKDRLGSVEEKIKQLETTIPSEINKWSNLQQKYREESPSKYDSHPAQSLESEPTNTHETCVKQLEMENNLPSVSSGTVSDDVFLVKDRSSSSNEYVDPVHHRLNTRHGGMTSRLDSACHDGFNFTEDDSLPSGIPVRLISDDVDGVADHQTSTPVTDRDLAYLKSTSKQRSHTLKHTSITSFKLDTSHRDSRLESYEQADRMETECGRNGKVLSPEQQGVKHFLKRRHGSDSRHSHSMDRSNLSSTSPVASSTFRYGDESILISETSPFSFTMRNDQKDFSQASYTKLLDDSKMEQAPNLSHQNCSSNLSFTFRNDSQLVPTHEDEDLPGFTRNQSFHTHRVDPDFEPVHDEGREILHEDMYMTDAHVQYTEVQIHERPDSSLLTDQTSLTNVTRPTGDFINSFDEKSNKNRWINKDVQMFQLSQQKQVESLTKPCSYNTVSVDETGDNGKPPLPYKGEPERNFLTEAEERLKTFKLRRNSCNSDVMAVGVCMEKQSYTSDGEISNDECAVEEVFVKETISEKQQCLSANIEKKFEEMENQAQSRNTTLQEFEKIEKLCEEEQRNKTLLSKIESQIIADPVRALTACVSRTSSMESKSSAKYHFLHDKGMTKIDSPSLTLVSLSPEKHRKDYRRNISFEEEGTDIVESGSESGTDCVYIDNDFRLSRPDTHTSTDDLTSVDTHHKTEETLSETDDYMYTYVQAEEEMMNRYLRTVDEGQETWENVMKWMHKECDNAEGAELEAELKSIIEQEDDLDGQSKGTPTLSDHNQEDSIYYSFQTQSGDIQQASEVGCLMSECDRKNGVPSDVGGSEDGDRDSIQSSSLMNTIMYGSVGAVENLLNSDITISESEIKEGLLWGLENKHLQITLLLLEDICKLIRAAEEEEFVEVFAAYSEKDEWNPVFIVLSKTEPVEVWDTFMGLPMYRRKYNQDSSETYLVENNSLVKSTCLSELESNTIRDVINRANLHNYHSKITRLNGSAFRSKKEGKELVKQTCIVIHCLLKGFIPFGEEPFPRDIERIPTDVRETFYATDILNEQTRLSPIQSDTNNNETLPGLCNTHGICQSDVKVPKGFVRQAVARVENNIPKVSECLNKLQAKDTVEVVAMGDDKSQSEGSLDTVLHEVVLLVLIIVSVSVALSDWFRISV